jgi:hypothetical protein
MVVQSAPEGQWGISRGWRVLSQGVVFFGVLDVFEGDEGHDDGEETRGRRQNLRAKDRGSEGRGRGREDLEAMELDGGLVAGGFLSGEPLGEDAGVVGEVLDEGTESAHGGNVTHGGAFQVGSSGEEVSVV